MKPKTHGNKERIERLYDHLSDLAMTWRTLLADNKPGNEVVQEYHETLKQLEVLGWDGVIYAEEMLPFEFMPENYVAFGENKPALKKR